MGEDETTAVAGRIKQFIESLGITITQFADNTGIQRSSMSQILGGRNQKISISTIGKIHATYPDLSIYWLLYGSGPILSGSATGSPEEQDEEPRLSMENTDPFLSLFDNESRVNVTEGTAESKYAKGNESNRRFDTVDKLGNERINAQNSFNNNTHLAGEKNKRVVKIMIFYSDNTFESFSPDHLA
ncbi:MAG TPA: helix-turn-helix domain-containing protein [Candidatus Barnesiella merdipullorum]|nr:helix-turn-helix domain-containing protein [Candidatus Barnesiella merdipullorum]